MKSARTISRMLNRLLVIFQLFGLSSVTSKKSLARMIIPLEPVPSSPNMKLSARAFWNTLKEVRMLTLRFFPFVNPRSPSSPGTLRAV